VRWNTGREKGVEQLLRLVVGRPPSTLLRSHLGEEDTKVTELGERVELDLAKFEEVLTLRYSRPIHSWVNDRRIEGSS
jgi:hypothetical protein